MKLKRTASVESMLDAFNRKIDQLEGEGEVVSTISIAPQAAEVTASRAVEIYEDDDWDEYEDVGGGFGEPGVHYTMRNVKDYWNESNESDPSLAEYDDFEQWWKDTHDNYLKRVESCGVLGGCHGKSTKSSETEIDDELEDVTGDEDLMEELDSEFIEDSTDVTCAFDVNSIDTDRLYEVIDKYNANSQPISGDWDNETADEQQTIANEFGISLDDAKQVMIEILGFPADDAFVEASTEVSASDDYNIYSGYDDIEDVSWKEVDSKQVQDSDGFWTDYTLYHNDATGQYACMFGDKDVYRPGEGYFDWEGDSEDEAYEWFESYEGLYED